MRKFADRMKQWQIVHIDETDSTNRWLRNSQGENPSPCCKAVWADFQTAGRGCGTNVWESERGQNLTFSVLIHPTDIPAQRQFTISMAAALAVVDALADYADGFSIKWPNDIYWHDRKICGMLIENRLTEGMIKDSIIGIGLNVNQQRFVSDAPNPVSLRQIIGRATDRQELLEKVLNRLSLPADANRYRSLLYRREGYHPYRDAAGDFEARLEAVEDDGHLVLQDTDGHTRRYAFKEVIFKIMPEMRNSETSKYRNIELSK